VVFPCHGGLQPPFKLIIGNGNGLTTTTTGLTWTTATNLLTATNISGNGSAITALNMGNAGSGTLAVGRGGTGGTTFTAGGLLIGNTTSAFSQATGLTWTTATNSLTATNISGNGSAITNLNAGNFASGIFVTILPIAYGGTGRSELLDQAVLIGTGANAITTYSGFTYDVANTSLKSDRITGVIQYSATVTNITQASIYISSTPTTTTAILKNIKTRNGEHIISTSSTSSSTIIENMFDNTTTSWSTATASYVKQADGTNTTGTNFPTVVTTPSSTIYGEWIQVKFPRRTCVDDISVLPLAGPPYPNSIYRWTLLATNNVAGNNWIRVYTNVKTFTTSSEQSLLPALGNANTIQYLYYRLVINEILGTTGSATGSTLSLSLLNVKFMTKDTIMYNDAILCIGEPIATAPVANTILNINGGVDINADLNVRCNIGVVGEIKSSTLIVDSNVSIGTTTTSDIDDDTGVVIPKALLYVKSPELLNGTCDVVIRGGLISGTNGGKAKIWLIGDAGNASYIQSEHTGNGNTLLSFGTAQGASLPTQKMIIGANGNVSIGSTDLATYKLLVAGNSFFDGVMNFNTVYNGGGADYPCNKINLWGTGGNYGFGISGNTLDYFTSTTHRWLYGGSGTNLGSTGTTLTNNNLSTSGYMYAGNYVQVGHII
jgi:hypothetical protein